MTFYSVNFYIKFYKNIDIYFNLSYYDNNSTEQRIYYVISKLS